MIILVQQKLREECDSLFFKQWLQDYLLPNLLPSFCRVLESAWSSGVTCSSQKWNCCAAEAWQHEIWLTRKEEVCSLPKAYAKTNTSGNVWINTLKDILTKLKEVVVLINGLHIPACLVSKVMNQLLGSGGNGVRKMLWQSNTHEDTGWEWGPHMPGVPVVSGAVRKTSEPRRSSQQMWLFITR